MIGWIPSECDHQGTNTMSSRFFRLFCGNPGCCGITSPRDGSFVEYLNMDDFKLEIELPREHEETAEEIKSIHDINALNGMGDVGFIDICKQHSSENESTTEASSETDFIDGISEDAFYCEGARKAKQSWSMSNVLNLSDSRDYDSCEADLSSKEKRCTFPPWRRSKPNTKVFQIDKSRENYSKISDNRGGLGHRGSGRKPQYHRIRQHNDQETSETSSESSADSGRNRY